MAGLALAIDLLLEKTPGLIIASAKTALHSTAALNSLAAAAAASSAVSFLPSQPALFAHFHARYPNITHSHSHLSRPLNMLGGEGSAQLQNDLVSGGSAYLLLRVCGVKSCVKGMEGNRGDRILIGIL
jgi:hypothetical protein